MSKKSKLSITAGNKEITIRLPIFSITALVLTILKLTHVINWSWLAVLSPIWAPFVLVFGFIAIVFALITILSFISYIIK